MNEKEKEWEVEKILQRGSINNMTHYLVKWVGYPLDEATWEPITNLDNCQHAILKFQHSLKELQKSARKKSKKKKQLKEVFSRERHQTLNNFEKKQLIQDGLVFKEVNQKNEVQQKEMIELIPTSQLKIGIDDDELEVEIVQPICQGNLKNEEEHNEISQKNDIKDFEIKNAENIQNVISPMKEVSSLNIPLPLTTIVPQSEEVLKKKSEDSSALSLNPNKHKPEEIPLLTENNAGKKDELYQPIQQNQEQQFKQRKKGKGRPKKKSKKQQNVKCFSNIAEPSEHIAALSEVSLEKNDQQIINNKSQIELSPQQPLKRSITLIELKDPEKLLQLLTHPREIQCDQALKTFQRNTILNIVQGESKNFSSPFYPLFDLHDSIQVLEQLGEVYILDKDERQMQTCFLVRLRHGWYAVGKVEETLSIISVSQLSENSWKKIFEGEKDKQ